MYLLASEVLRGTVIHMSSQQPPIFSLLPESGMVSVTEQGAPVIIFPGALGRAEAVDRAYMTLCACIGMTETDSRLANEQVGGPDSPLANMLLAPLYLRVSQMFGTELDDGIYLDNEIGEFPLTAVNLEDLVTVDIDAEGSSISLR